MKLGDAIAYGFNNLFNFQGCDSISQFRQFVGITFLVCLLAGALLFGSSFYDKYDFLEHARGPYGDSLFRQLPDHLQAQHRESTVIEGLKLGFVAIVLPLLLTLSSHVRRIRDAGFPGGLGFLLPLGIFPLPFFLLVTIVLGLLPSKKSG